MKVRHFQNKYVESLTNLTKFNPHERGTVRSHKPVRLAEDCREIEIIRVLKKSIIISFDLACISKSNTFVFFDFHKRVIFTYISKLNYNIHIHT